MAQRPELSPPSPGPCTYGPAQGDDRSPSILRTTFSNNVCYESPGSSGDAGGGGGAEPSPLRQPMKPLAPAAPAHAAAGYEHASPGHLILRMASSQAGEAGAGGGPPLGSKHRLSYSAQPEEPEGASPRIAAHHSPGASCALLAGQQQQRGRRASAASDGGSFIEWSLSGGASMFAHRATASAHGEPPPAPLPSGGALLAGLSGYSALVVAGSSEGEEGEGTPSDDSASSSLGYPMSGGHLIAPAAPRFLWSPSSDGGGGGGGGAGGDSAAAPSPPSVQSSPGRAPASGASSPPSAGAAARSEPLSAGEMCRACSLLCAVPYCWLPAEARETQQRLSVAAVLCRPRGQPSRGSGGQRLAAGGAQMGA